VRVLRVVLTLELLWVLLLTVAVVFLAAPLAPVGVLLALVLIGARRGVDQSARAEAPPLRRVHRLALWCSAGANAVVVLSILTSLYHAQSTWLVVGLLLAAGLTTVAWACARTALYSVAMARRMSRLAARRAGNVPANRPASAERTMKTTI